MTESAFSDPDRPRPSPSDGLDTQPLFVSSAEACPTIHLDTSSSNAWLRYFPGLTLAEVFRRALTLLGSDRLLFGSDSSCFQRGWRPVIYGAQRTALNELGVEPDVSEQIFASDFARIFGI